MSSRSRILSRTAIVLAAMLAVAVVAWFTVPALIMRPSHSRVGPAPSDLHAEEVTFPSASGAIIHAWFMRGQPHRGAVLLLHGVHANRLMEIGRARFLHGAGYAVLAIDFRAHGESTGDSITFGYLESRDVTAALAYLRRQCPGERIGVIGTSMGGAAFLLATPQPNVAAAVLEQVYPSIDLALDHRMTRYLGPFGHVLSPLALRLLSERMGIRPDQLRPIGRISSLHAPLLLIGGGSDPYTLVKESRAMYDAAPGPKQLWIVAGAGHVDLQRHVGTAYQRRILDFFDQTLRQPGTVHRSSSASTAGARP